MFRFSFSFSAENVKPVFGRSLLYRLVGVVYNSSVTAASQYYSLGMPSAQPGQRH